MDFYSKIKGFFKNNAKNNNSKSDKHICDICEEFCIPKKLYERGRILNKDPEKLLETRYCVFDRINLNSKNTLIKMSYSKNIFDLEDIYDHKPSNKCEYKSKGIN